MSSRKESGSMGRFASPTPASIIAPLAAGAQIIHNLPDSGTTNSRTGKIRKLHIFNGQAGQVLITIGQGAGGAFVQMLPAIAVPAGMDVELQEEDIPGVEFTANITAWSSAAAAAPANITITPEVEEFVGTGG